MNGNDGPELGDHPHQHGPNDAARVEGAIVPASREAHTKLLRLPAGESVTSALRRVRGVVQFLIGIAQLPLRCLGRFLLLIAERVIRIAVAQRSAFPLGFIEMLRRLVDGSIQLAGLLLIFLLRVAAGVAIDGENLLGGESRFRIWAESYRQASQQVARR